MLACSTTVWHPPVAVPSLRHSLRRPKLTRARGTAQTERGRDTAELPSLRGTGGGGANGWLNAEGAPLTADEAKSLRLALGRPRGALAALLRAGLAKEARDLPELEGAMLAAEQACVGALPPDDGGSGGGSGGGGEMGAEEGRGGADADPLAGTGRPRDVGVWQPVFASAGGFPRLLYIPVPEYFDLSDSGGAAGARHERLRRLNAAPPSPPLPRPHGAGGGSGAAGGLAGALGSVDVVTELGPLVTHFLGPCLWVDDVTFEYWVESCRVEVPAWGVKFTVPFRLHNALTFFYVDCPAGLACARSRLGGTMLLAADPPAGAKYAARRGPPRASAR